MLFTTLITTFALFSATGWAGYTLQDDYMAAGFFNQFTFFDSADPTHGFVDYQTYDASLAAGLISQTSSQIKMGVDSTNNYTSGRPSVRITSNKSYSSGLVVIDIEHMPGGVCGTWPAFWMVGPNWPIGGEIDIIEGVNDQTSNDATLHTGPGCSISDNGGFTGSMTSTTCESSGSSNQGCQIHSDDSRSYGTGFNDNNGGVYATEWTGTYINVYFFPRGSVPDDVLGDAPNPSGWGTPFARFSGGCDFGTAFVQQQLVFDTTFCGDWAGNTWASSSCAAKATTCEAYVGGNPDAFVDAYWAVNALKVYQSNGAYAPASTYVATSTSVAYVTQPTAAAEVPSPTAPIVPADATSSPSSSSSSPSESGTGYAPVIGGNGVVGGSAGSTPAPAPAPAETGGEGEWSTASDGALQYEGRKRDEGLEAIAHVRHAKHLRFHKRVGGWR